MGQVKRTDFTDAEIQACWAKCPGATNRVHRTAHWLNQLGRGKVSNQLALHWLRGIGLVDQPTTVRGPYKKKALSMAVANDKNFQRGPKVLSIDIETSPITAYVWSLWKQNVGLNQIKEEWNILSFCAKWLHEDDPVYDDARANPIDDEHLLRQIWKLLDEADIVITQNGKRFDVPKINARFLLLGMLPPSPYKVIDTMLIAKQQFGFTSKKLEWMTDKLCKKHKKQKHNKFPGFELWSECLKGNPEAWDEMRDYNIPDVLSMEELYLIMRPWYVGHPNVAIYFKDDEVRYRCPKCGSDHIKQDGVAYTQSGEYEKMHCLGCGGWSRGRYTLNSKEVRRVLLSN